MTNISDDFLPILDDALLSEKEDPERDALSMALSSGILGYPLADKPWDQGCERQIYYQWTKEEPDEPGPKFPPRMYRVFDMGHDSEERMADYLRDADLVLRTHRPDEEIQRLGLHSPQYGFAMVGKKLKGKVDGIVAGWRTGSIIEKRSDQGTLPPAVQALAFPCLWEHKALALTGFKNLKKKGLKASWPKYYGQVQLNMAGMKMTDNPTLFTAICRDTGDIYIELVHYDSLAAQSVSDRAVRIIRAHPDNGGGGVTDLARAGDKPDAMPCKFCKFKERCHRQDVSTQTMSQHATPKPAWLTG